MISKRTWRELLDTVTHGGRLADWYLPFLTPVTAMELLRAAKTNHNAAFPAQLREYLGKDARRGPVQAPKPKPPPVAPAKQEPHRPTDALPHARTDHRVSQSHRVHPPVPKRRHKTPTRVAARRDRQKTRKPAATAPVQPRRREPPPLPVSKRPPPPPPSWANVFCYVGGDSHTPVQNDDSATLPYEV